jgi:tripartite-type tricarboxylate transporter receptor subunit TctC
VARQANWLIFRPPVSSRRIQEAAPPVRPILTFGAKRNPELATVPTLAERTSDPEAAIASAIAVFAPRVTSEKEVAAIASVLSEVAAEPAIKKEAASRNFPLKVSRDAAVTAAMKRDARVIEQHMSYLKR